MTQATPKVVLITGAGSGIGRAVALAFARPGVHLVLLGRSLPKLEAVAAQGSLEGAQCTVHSLDLAQVDRVRPTLEAISTAAGAVDVLVNSAGIAYTQNLADTPLEAWQQVLDLNLTSVLQCIQGVLPTMRRQRRGTIINISSIAGHQVFPQWGAYCVSKFGLMALGKALAQEERPHGIRVTTVCPGAVDTPLWDAVAGDFNRAAMLSPESVAQVVYTASLLPPEAVLEEVTLLPQAGTL